MIKTTIVCLNQNEENIAREYLKQRGAEVKPTEIVTDFTLREVVGEPPNAQFPSRYSKLGPTVRLVSGIWP